MIFFVIPLYYFIFPYIRGFLFLVFVKPISESAMRSFSGKVYSWDVDYYRITYKLKKALNGQSNLDGYKLLNDGYVAHNYFYVRFLQDLLIQILVNLIILNACLI